MEIESLTLTTLGEVLIGLTILYVHHKILKEHKLDRKVYSGIQLEQWTGSIGIILIILGYLIRVI